MYPRGYRFENARSRKLFGVRCSYLRIFHNVIQTTSDDLFNYVSTIIKYVFALIKKKNLKRIGRIEKITQDTGECMPPIKYKEKVKK